MMGIQKEMRPYVESHYPILYLVTFEKELADRAIHDLADGRKIFEWDMARGCVDFDNKAPLTPYMDLPAALENWLAQDLDYHFLVIGNADLALRNSPQAVARLEALARKVGTGAATVFLVSSQLYVPPELEMLITVFDQPKPGGADIARIIREHAAPEPEGHGYDIDPEVIDKLVPAFRGLREYEIIRLLNRGYQQDGRVGEDDVELVIQQKRQIVKKRGILEMPSVVEGIDDIGGLAQLKAWLERKAKIMADLARAREFGVETPKGAVIVGMPGCGKSLTAKAASVRFGLPLLRLDIGALMGRYVGDSEANMRRALELAGDVSPCVLWVDEIEKAFAGIGGGASSSSEITSRLFGYFLTWMQEKTDPVFVLATANDVSALPPELLRKGRFDEIFYVDLPDEKERAAILDVHLRKRAQDTARIDARELASRTKGFSGADLECVVKDAIEEAFLNDKSGMSTEFLLRSIQGNTPQTATVERAADLRKKFESMGIKRASGE